MASIFLQYPPLAGLYDRWRADNIEFGAAALVQNVIVIAFGIHENFTPAFEQPPGRGERRNHRADAMVLKYDPRFVSHAGHLLPRLLVEIKGGGGSVREVETQALLNAQSSMRDYGLQDIFVQTVIGIDTELYFRFWRIANDQDALTPLDGGPPFESHRRAGYTNLNTDNGDLLLGYYDQVKIDAPMVPSQDDALSDSEGEGAQEGPRSKKVHITKKTERHHRDKYLYQKHTTGRVHTTRIEHWNEENAPDGTEILVLKKNNKYWGLKPL